MNECLCGCGELVKNRYCSGHDRRHTARLVREVKNGDKSLEEALDDIGPHEKLAQRFENELAASRA